MLRYCDLTCEYAKWPDKLHDGSKTCRTFIALHCTLLDCLVDKNSRCKAQHLLNRDNTIADNDTGVKSNK